MMARTAAAEVVLLSAGTWVLILSGRVGMLASLVVLLLVLLSICACWICRSCCCEMSAGTAEAAATLAAAVAWTLILCGRVDMLPSLVELLLLGPSAPDPDSASLPDPERGEPPPPARCKSSTAASSSCKNLRNAVEARVLEFFRFFPDDEAEEAFLVFFALVEEAADDFFLFFLVFLEDEPPPPPPSLSSLVCFSRRMRRC